MTLTNFLIMNILILSDLIVYSGVGQYMVQLGEAIAENSNNTVVLASPYIERTDIPRTIVKIKLTNPRNILNYLRQLNFIVKKYNIEVVHCNHRKQAFMMKLYQLFFGKIATVWTCHTVPYPNNWIKRLFGYYGHKAIAISTEAQIWMEKELHIKESRVDKITNGVDNSSLVIPSIDKSKLKERFFKKYFNEIIDGTITDIIISHGRLDPVKGIHLLIEAFAQLDECQKHRIKIVLSGDTNVPYYQELVLLVRKYNLSDVVYFTGWISSNEILSIADIMVQPSYREGFPLSAIEAFFMKVPLIRTFTGGYEDMKDYCIGIPSHDVKAINKELYNWISNPNSLKDMVEKAYQFAIREGTIKVMANRTIETYKRAIDIVKL